MGLFSTLTDLCLGKRRSEVLLSAAKGHRPLPPTASRRNRRCQIEALESRQMMAATPLSAPVILGSVYFEEATGDDSQADVIQVSFKGGAAGTTLDRLVINGDKQQDGLSTGDVFFDTAAGGLGAFKDVGFSIVGHAGFTVDSVSVVDGGSQIVFTFSGFDPGEIFSFSLDADEAQFVESGALNDGHIDPSEVDSNSLVEGGEFQRSIMTGEFSAPHHVDLTLTGLFWDDFDDKFNTAQSQAGNVLALPNDVYTPGHDYADRSAGAIALATQLPLATISGWVYHDQNDNGQFAHGSETGIGGVTVELLKNGVPTGITTTTSTSPGTLGYYEFKDLVPGSYGVREVQPAGWLDGKDTPGDHGGTAGNDIITGAVLDYRDNGLEYNFGELLPGSIRGTVQAHTDAECDFDDPELLLSGVQIDLLDASGLVIATTQTDVHGAYEFTGLVPGTYQVREHQPTAYYNDDERVGTAGGVSGEIGNTYSFISGIQLGSGVHAYNYDFCEHVGVMLSGNVYHDRDDDGVFDRGGAAPENGIGNVIVQLYKVNDSGQLVATGLTATTDSAGFYKFNNLEAGKYAVKELQPAGWLDGKDTAGNLGGVVATPSTADQISMIMIGWGQMGTEYNFGELLPGSIRGRVIVSSNPDCDPSDPEETPIAGVVIDLLDGNGHLIRSTTTHANGEYAFTDLPPGTYAVHEHETPQFFDHESHLGSGDGVIVSSNDLGSIHIGSDQHLIDYGFCETPPGSISGQVQAHTDEDCDFDNPEIVLEGVTIELRDASGHVIATTTTNAEGRYSFTHLPPGEYSVHEIQPAGYYDGDQRVGDVGGIDDGVDSIHGIQLPAGHDAIHYDFCEHVGVMLSGYVYHDRSDDGIFDRGGANPETGIAGVTVKLFKKNDSGQLVNTGLTAITDATGFYKFNNLEAGTYAVAEIQPSGWLDGKDTPGNLGGMADASPPGDLINMIMIGWGQMGTEYNFGELLPGSIRGRVIVSTNPECDPSDPNETPIPNVTIDLLDVDGNVIRSTTTNANGEYAFTNLRPGQYSVREHQPGQYFDHESHIGSGGGVIISTNQLGAIAIGSDQHLIDYGFCEEPPAELSGYVFLDGGPIPSDLPLTPEQIAAQRDGLRTPDDTPLPGVKLRLIDLATLLPIQSGSQFVLPGIYPPGEIVIVTDAHGFYHFTGLREGVYAVVEVQPDYTDGLDTAGHHSGALGEGELDHGYAVNEPDVLGTLPEDVRATIEKFRAAFGDNAIVLIPVPVGQHSQENNFSEVAVIPPITDPPPPPPFLPPVVPPPPTPFVFGPPGPAPAPRLVLPPAPVVIPADDYHGGGAKAIGYTWHLSVIDAGQPRSVRLANSLYQFASTEIDVAAWQNVPLDAAKWTLARVEGGNVSIQREEVFGNGNATPVTGDFDGDGVTDVGVFIAGRWYLDLNGNGKWDEGDLWAKLGSEDDLPVTGDWDDDGKTDIGIYGPAWPRDPWAIQNEPGLPDAANYPTRPGDKVKNMPPTKEDATSGARVLKRTAQGKARADLIDHVFHYGTPGDVPITGDWNGDGIRDIGVFRDGQWTLDMDGDGRFTDADMSTTFGQAGDLPVVGDFNGDGIDDIGVYRSGHWILDMNGDRQIDAHDQVFELGGAGDVPVVGDWNGDGTDDPGVYHATQPVARAARRAG